ncbi:MAG TPA: hypothetical protein VMV92_37930 [Streptosporangiaceae bacterium]|nr:hypothetical protein [Streptosporangiaceae bacterium]
MRKGKVSLSEAEMMEAIEADYPAWSVFPHPAYPDTQQWMARRYNTAMPEPVRCPGLAEIPTAIEKWTSEHNIFGYKTQGYRC